jgi:diguanylate cyclase (GGDEF)-like protein
MNPADNRTNQIVATGLLDRLGCTFEVVANGHEAVIAVQERSYDAILMDCNMPEMDGYQACAYIRELQSSNEQQVAIIAMTANAQQAEVEKCRSVGMNRHIAKPFAKPLSLAKVRQALEECLLLPGQGSPIPSPTTTDVRTEEAAIDIEVMQQLREALGGGASEMIKVFLEDTPVYLDQLQKAVAADDFEAICAMAHTIKGSGSNFGANQLAGFCAKLEEAARARSQEGVPELISSCVDEYAKVSQALRKEGGPVSIQHVAADEDSPLILIVDDDRTTQIALRHALDAEGFRVEVVSNGEEAISAIGKISPELILMDAIMPVMDGFATTRQLARMPGSEQVPVLMITSLDDPASIDLAFAAGAIDYIPKPIHFAVLTHRIKQIVNARRAEGKVRRLAYHDSLTGLPNRVRFLDHVSHTLQRHGRENRQLAILFLDLDRFKLINDTLGHNIGDELLKAVGMRITHALRGSDMLARLGGDEFTVVLEDLPAPKIAGVVAGKICKTLGTPFSIGGHEIFVGISIGISLFPSDGANVSSLLKNADTAMYRAKKNGNGFLYYEEGMGSTFSKKLLLENSLRRALERNEMEVFYQPKYSLERNCTIGAEALVRWRHPSEGLISPLHFIPLAEESGLIIPIGEWVMRTACAQIKKWLDAGFPDLTIAVNLSVRQIVQANFVEVVARVIHETGIPAHLLELEITESVLMENAKEAMQSLQQLRDMGVTLAVDDFGTGYSSFAYLKRLPISVLKIDRTFIRDIDALPDDAAIVTGMIVLAHTLRLQVVAEGVETATQEAFLREKGCDMIQGYYLSEPIPAAQFEQRVLKSPFPKPSLVLMWDQVQS